MRRRNFIKGIVGSAVVWPPLAVRAQQPEGVQRIGVLMNLAEDDPEASARIGTFVQRLSQLGWSKGRNFQIDYRWAAGKVRQICWRAGCARAECCFGVWLSERSRLTSGDPNYTCRICEHYGPGWQRVCQ